MWCLHPLLRTVFVSIPMHYIMTPTMGQKVLLTPNAQSYNDLPPSCPPTAPKLTWGGSAMLWDTCA